MTHETPSVTNYSTQNQDICQRKHSKTVGSGITDYKTKFYFTIIVKSFV